MKEIPRSAFGVGFLAFVFLLLAQIYGLLEPTEIAALLLFGGGVCGYWWWKLGES